MRNGRITGAISEDGSFVITKFILMESGAYHERFLRSLKMGSITQETVDTLSEEIIRTNGRSFSPGAITSMRTAPISLEEQIDRETNSIDLIRGWESKRFCFIMQIIEEAPSVHMKDRRYTVTGYTDRLEFSKYTKSIPEDLEFYVNSVLETSNGKSRSNMQLFTNSNVNSTSENLFMLRPSDVISKHMFMNMQTGSSTRHRFSGGSVTGKTFQTNSRINTIGSSFLAKTLSGLHKTRMEKEVSRHYPGDEEYECDGRGRGNSFMRGRSTGRASEIENELEDARISVRDSPAEEYSFILKLKDMARDTGSVGSFKFRALLREVPDVEEYVDVNVLRTDISSITGRHSDNNDRVGNMDGERWGYSTTEEMIITSVSNAFSTIALNCFILNADMIFTLVEDDLGEYEWEFQVGVESDFGEDEGSIMFFDDVAEELERELIDKLGYSLIDSVLNSFRRYGHDIFISIQYNMNREMFIKVAIDSDEAFEMCTPVFCDSLVSPSLTTKERHVSRIGEGVSELYKEVNRSFNGR